MASAWALRPLRRTKRRTWKHSVSAWKRLKNACKRRNATRPALRIIRKNGRSLLARLTVTSMKLPWALRTMTKALRRLRAPRRVVLLRTLTRMAISAMILSLRIRKAIRSWPRDPLRSLIRNTGITLSPPWARRVIARCLIMRQNPQACPSRKVRVPISGRMAQSASRRNILSMAWKLKALSALIAVTRSRPIRKDALLVSTAAY